MPFETRNLIVSAIEVDPYLNFDAGTMDPFEHEKVYVLEDGGGMFTGRSDGNTIMEIGELKGHPYFVTSQFHPSLNRVPEDHPRFIWVLLMSQ